MSRPVSSHWPAACIIVLTGCQHVTKRSRKRKALTRIIQAAFELAGNQTAWTSTVTTGESALVTDNQHMSPYRDTLDITEGEVKRDAIGELYADQTDMIRRWIIDLHILKGCSRNDRLTIASRCRAKGTWGRFVTPGSPSTGSIHLWLI